MLFIEGLFLCWAICPSAVISAVISNATPKTIELTDKATKNSTTSDKKNKRLVDSQTAELSLLQAGVFLAEPSLLGYGESTFQPYDQYNHSELYLSQFGPSDLHQGEAPLVASRHPTKPVYHYTPLPQGTFPAKTIPDEKGEEEVPNRSGQEYWYDYLVRDGNHGLDLGQKEARQGNLVRGAYHVLLPDRRMQVVQYWSDWSGYHPTITYSYP